MNTLSLRRLAATTVLLGSSLSSAVAQCPSIDEVTPAGIGGGSGYGGSLAASGSRVAAGASNDSVNNVQQGSVYVSSHDGFSWSLDQQVVAADGASLDAFGTRVALDGDVLAIAAPFDDDQGTDSGSVYVYRFDGATWNQEAKLLEPGGGASRGYGGTHLALDAEVLVVSRPSSVDVWRFGGKFVGWQFEQTISGSTFFAQSFDVQGDELILGSTSDGQGGCVYVYQYDGVSQWSQTDHFAGSDTASGDRFGTTVVVDGGVLAVGDSEDGADGSLYLFEDLGGTWSEIARLFPSISVRSFGSKVALHESNVLVAGDNREVAFEFRRVKGSWIEATVYDEAADNRFGVALALAGKHALIASGNERVWDFPASNLHLVSDNLSPSSGDLIHLRTTPGPPGNVLAFFVMEINGTPFRMRLVTFKFGGDYSFTIQATVPPGLAGNRVGFQSFGLGAGGRIEESNLLNIDFQ